MATKKTKTAAAKPASKTVKKSAAAKPAKATKKPAKAAVVEEVACTCCAAPEKKTAKKAAAPKGTRVIFHVRAEAGSKVYIAGCFNNWDPTSKPLTDKNGTGDYSITLTLKPGTYQYKFVINGTWCADPECTEWVPNDMGTLNSVCVVE